MDIFWIAFVSGLFSGSIYALIAIGYVVVYKSTKVLNFSHGMLVVVGGYLVWSVLSIGLPVWLGLICAFALTMALNMVFERVFIRPLIGQPILASVMITLSLVGGLKGLIFLIWGSQGKAFPVDVVSKGVWDLGWVILPKEKAMALLACLIIVIALYLFFKYASTGLAMKVTSEDHFIGQIVGLKINRVFSYSWGIAGLVATVGGLFLGMIICVRPELEEVGLKALAAMLLGGLESLPGAVIGGLIIGLAEALTGLYLSNFLGEGIGEVFPYLLIIAVLLLRPYGIFGWKKIERV